MQPTVVLVHGFLRKAWDMRFLSRFFEQHSYRVIAPDLPATMGGIARSTEILSSLITKEAWDTIHFVGHSTGGRIILELLARHTIPQLGRVVLVATPVNGSWMAHLGTTVPFIARIWRTLADLSVPADSIPRGVAIGVIAGGRNQSRGYNPLLPGDNDDLIAVNETQFPGMHAFRLYPYSHQRIHKHRDVARNILSFLEHGYFFTHGAE